MWMQTVTGDGVEVETEGAGYLHSEIHAMK